MPWDEVLKNREASFLSLRNIFLHIVEVENLYIHQFLSGKKREEWVRIDPEEFTDIDSVGKWMYETESKTRRKLGELTSEKLARKVEFRARDGKIITIKVEDVYLAAFAEYLFHTGEMITLIWQMNIEPPPMQWYYYAAEPTRF